MLEVLEHSIGVGVAVVGLMVLGGLFGWFAVSGIAACIRSSQISREEEKGPGRLFAPDDLYALAEEDRRIGITEDPPVEGDE